jgi:hypothetical protein
MIFRSLLITDLLPLSTPERRGMLIAALVVLGAGLGLRGSSGLGSDEVLRVNMKGPRGLLRVYCEVDRNTAFVVELCLQQEGFARSAKAVHASLRLARCTAFCPIYTERS